MKLKQETEDRVAQLVAAGRFRNADEVVNLALNIVKSDDSFASDFVSKNRKYLEEAMEAAQAEPARPMSEGDWRELHNRVEERSGRRP